MINVSALRRFWLAILKSDILRVFRCLLSLNPPLTGRTVVVGLKDGNQVGFTLYREEFSVGWSAYQLVESIETDWLNSFEFPCDPQLPLLVDTLSEWRHPEKLV